MTERLAERALYFEAASEAVFAILHSPGRDPSFTAVVLAPPWGWEEVASYRSRRAWAEHLAAAGHPVLRFDFPGSGDSTGSPSDLGRVAVWTAAITTAATWLRAATGAERIAVIGLGLAGLIAGTAIVEGAPIDDLVLWSASTRGRSFIREARAFSRLQTSYVIERQGEEALPRGWLEVNGFVLSAETTEDLALLQLSGLDLSRLDRALLLERDGLGVDAGLRQQLTKSGVEVTVGPGPGWEAMCLHPAEFRSPLAVFGQVSDWLADGARRPSSAVRAAIAAHAAMELVVGNEHVTESPLVVDGPSGRLFGLLAEPTAVDPLPFTALFLNAGAVRRIGPNRMWIEAARQWAARGVTTLRIDIEGLGDSDGDAACYSEVGELYGAPLGAQVTRFLDALEAQGRGSRYMLVGLCAGGYWGFQTAAHDERIGAAVLINAGALVWDPALIPSHDARKLHNLGRARAWRKLVRGRVSPRRMLTVARAAVASSLFAHEVDEGRRGVADAIEAMLDDIHSIGTRVVLAFSANEPLYAELEACGIVGRLESWPNVELVHLPGGDHTVRPVIAQRSVRELLDRELELQLARGRGA